MTKYLKETPTGILLDRYYRSVDRGLDKAERWEILKELDSRNIDIAELVRATEGSYPYDIMMK